MVSKEDEEEEVAECIQMRGRARRGQQTDGGKPGCIAPHAPVHVMFC